jgi:hypothetical protein
MHLSRLSLALAILTSAAAILATGAGAQDGDIVPQANAEGGPQNLDELVDFVIRPTQDATEDDDIWNWENEPGPSALDNPIGPQLAGPREGETIGPPLSGPVPEPLEIGKITPRHVSSAKPFDAVGVDVGGFIIRPSIEIGGIATDNASGSVDKIGAVGAILAPGIEVTSENDRYKFEAHGRGELVTYDRSEFDERTADARAKLRYNLSSATALDFDGGYARFLGGFNDPNTPAAAAERPGVDLFDATVGVEQRFGRLSAKLSAFADHEFNEDVALVGGGTADRSELDNTDFGSRLRVGYASSASLRPFAEAAVGRRAFDHERDDSGFARSSVWGEMRGGVVIDRGDKLSGEASLGYRREDIEDERLQDLNVLLANAAILWSPRRLTDLRLDLATSVGPTITPGVSASITYAGTLTLLHSFTPRVRGDIGVGLSHEHEVGGNFRDLTFTGFAGASYAFNRVASLEGRYTYQLTNREGPVEQYDANTVWVRLRFQR